MAAIAIPPVAEWNVKANLNIGCWQCEHFQRYDSSQNPTECEGECRKDSPMGINGYELELVSPLDWPIDGYFPYIPNGNIAWCNGFQRSLEQNIPPSPGDTYQDCANQDPVTWTRPDNVRSPSMFRKKVIEESCWFCDHFQRRYVDPSSVPPSSGCGGYCQHMHQTPYSAADGGLPPGPPQNISPRIFRLFPRIGFAPLTWCSRWERTSQTVPPVPENNNVICDVPE